MEGLTALIGLDFNLHEILAIVFCCQRFSKFKREHSGFFVFELLEFFCTCGSCSFISFISARADLFSSKSALTLFCHSSIDCSIELKRLFLRDSKSRSLSQV